jgi:NOL1/NOP2/sun family putative RNA methylase
MKLPARFEEKMLKLMGKEEYEQLAAALTGERVYGLRVNTLKISIDEFQEISPFDLEAVPWADDGFYISGEDAPGRHPYYHAGLYYIQEPSAMLPGQVLGAEPGERVLDLCAAPGGKTVQIAAAMRGKGLLVSNDINTERVKALVKNVELCGIRNAVVLNESPENLVRNFAGYFDRILIDAPCSGEGMFRKDETAVRSWESFKCERCTKMQESILHYADLLLRPGGTLVYSTCTFSPEENERMIIDFIVNHEGYELVDIPKVAGIEGCRPEWARDSGEIEPEMAPGVGESEPEMAPGVGESEPEMAPGVGEIEPEMAPGAVKWEPESAQHTGGREPETLQGDDETSARPVDIETLRRAARLWPHKVRGEGHFVAKLVKKGTSETRHGRLHINPGTGQYGADAYKLPGEKLRTVPDISDRFEEPMSVFADGFKESAPVIIGRSEVQAHNFSDSSKEPAPGFSDSSEEPAPGFSDSSEEPAPGFSDRSEEPAPGFSDKFEGTIPYEKLPEVFHKFVEENMNFFPDGVFLLKGHHLYHLPEPLPLLSGLKVAKFGWFLGTIEDSRFEPSHSLVMALGKEAFKRTLDLGSESAEVRSYLKGETLILKGEKGLTAVCVDGKTLGWARQSGEMLKNLYPKGWRMMK